MSLSREKMLALQSDLAPVLKAIAIKHGVTLDLTDTGGAFAIAINGGPAPAVLPPITSVLSQKALEQQQAAEAYDRLCTQYGMQKEWRGRWFISPRSNKQLKIVGLLPNRHKNCVLVVGTGGGEWIMPPENVIAAFRK